MSLPLEGLRVLDLSQVYAMPGAGMYLAADLSRRQGWLSDADVERIRALLVKARLPVQAPDAMTTDQFLALMAVDKKVLDGGLRLVLLKAIGEALVTGDFQAEHLKQTLDAA